MTTTLRIAVAALAASLLAACGGGGRTAASVPAATPAPIPGGGVTSPASGARLTLKFNRSKTAAHKLAAAARGKTSAHGLAMHRAPSGTRSVKDIDNNTEGVQVSVTSGSQTQTYYYSVGNAVSACSTDAATSVETCTFSVPTVGANENIQVLEVDQAPNDVNDATGLGTSIPSNANVLAVGSQNNVVVTAGGITALSISMNPIVEAFGGGCGNYTYDSGSGSDRIGLDTSTSPARVVVDGTTAITPTTTAADEPGSPVFFAPAGPADIDGTTFGPIGYNTDGTPIGQPLVDANGLPTATTIVSSSQHLKFVNWVEADDYSDGIQGDAYVPEPGATPGSTVTISNSSEFFSGDGGEFGCFYESVVYDGQQTAPSTITISNNLTATPPSFTGTPAGSGTHANSFAAAQTFEFAPLSASPQTLTFTNGDPQTVTGTDPDAAVTMDNDTACFDETGGVLAQIASGSGDNTFIVTPSANGTCTFGLYDDQTGVKTTITATIDVTTFSAARRGASVRSARMKGVPIHR